MTRRRMQNLDDGGLRLYSGMTDGQLRRGEGLGPGYGNGVFIAESKLVVERALDAGLEPISIFVEEKWLAHEEPVIERLEGANPNIDVFIATNGQFRELTGYEVTRGALAAFRRPPLPAVEEVVRDARTIAVLEDVGNYANIGSIFRSAAALGVDAVLATPSCHDPFYRRAARVSMGAVFQVPWTRIGTQREWAAEGVPMLRSLGFTTVAMALHSSSVDLDSPVLAACPKIAVVMGTEGEGLFESTIEACDHCVTIPMRHNVDSLNVATASAVAFWELCRRPGSE